MFQTMYQRYNTVMPGNNASDVTVQPQEESLKAAE